MADEARLQGFGLAAATLVAGGGLALAGPLLLVHLLADGGLAGGVLGSGGWLVLALLGLQLLVGLPLGIYHLLRPLPLALHCVLPALVVGAGVWLTHQHTAAGVQALVHAAAADKLRLWATVLGSHDLPRQLALCAVGGLGLYLALLGALTLLVRRGRGPQPPGLDGPVQLVGAAVLGAMTVGLALALLAGGGAAWPGVFVWLAALLAIAAGLLLLAGRVLQGLLPAADRELARDAMSGFLLCGLGGLVALAGTGAGVAAAGAAAVGSCGSDLDRLHLPDLLDCGARAGALQHLGLLAATLPPLLLLAASLNLVFTSRWAPRALGGRGVRAAALALLLLGAVGAEIAAGVLRDGELQRVTDGLLAGREQAPPPGVTPPPGEQVYLDQALAERRTVLGLDGERTLLLGAETLDVGQAEGFGRVTWQLEASRADGGDPYQGPYLAADRATPLGPVLEVAVLAEHLARCELKLLLAGAPGAATPPAAGVSGRFLAGLAGLPRILPLGLARGATLCGQEAPLPGERVTLRLEPQAIRVAAEAGDETLLTVEGAADLTTAALAEQLAELAGETGDAATLLVRPAAEVTLGQLTKLLEALQVAGLARGAGSPTGAPAPAGQRVAVLSLPADLEVTRWDRLARGAGLKKTKARPVIRRRRGKGKRRRQPRALDVRDEAGLSGRGRAVIERVVSGANQTIQRCYNALLDRRPGLGGRVKVRVRVEADGAITGCTVARDTLGDSDLAACITSAVRVLRFPPADRATEVTHTFSFRDLGQGR